MAKTKEQIAAEKLAADTLAAEQQAAADKKAADEKAAADKAAADKLAAEPKSEKLTALNAKLSEAKKKATTLPEDSKEQDEAFMDVYKIKEEIKVEIANIRRTEAEAAQKEKDAKVIGQVDTLLALHVSNQNAIGNPDLSNDEKNAINDNFMKVYHDVCNKLLGKAPKTSVAGTATTSGTKGETSSKILELIKANRAAGMNDADNKKAVVDAGFAVGTIWGILDKFKKENGAVA